MCSSGIWIPALTQKNRGELVYSIFFFYITTLFHLFGIIARTWKDLLPLIIIGFIFLKEDVNGIQLFSYLFSVFENKDKIVIVMEYASKGELYDYISERRRLSERETRHFFRQIVSAVHHCHKVRKPMP